MATYKRLWSVGFTETKRSESALDDFQDAVERLFDKVAIIAPRDEPRANDARSTFRVVHRINRRFDVC